MVTELAHLAHRILRLPLQVCKTHHISEDACARLCDALQVCCIMSLMPT